MPLSMQQQEKHIYDEVKVLNQIYHLGKHPSFLRDIKRHVGLEKCHP